MKRLVTVLGSVVVLALGAPEVRAQVRLGGEVSYGDSYDVAIGARLVASLRSMIPGPSLAFHASFDYFFPDVEGLTYWEINPGIVYGIPVRSPGFSPYLGGGLNIAYASSDLTDASDTDLGLNVMGGLQFGAARLRPFVEARLTISGGDQFVLTGGLLF